MTLKDSVAEAAFWDRWICLRCGETWDENPGLVCDSCESGKPYHAASLQAALDELEGEGEEE